MAVHKNFFTLLLANMYIVCMCVTSTANAQTNIFGLKHTALGGASLTVAGDNLLVSNIGSSGQDGVRIDIPPGVVLWKANLASLGDANTNPDGSFLEATSSGTLNGQPDQTISKIRAEDTGSEISLSMDFSQVQPTSVRVDYFSGGNMVDSETISGATPSWTVGFWPDSWDVDIGCCPFHISGSLDWIVARNVESSSGASFTTDFMEVHVLASPSITSGNYSDVALTAGGIPGFTITDETIVIPEPSALVLAAGGLLGLVGYRWRREFKQAARCC